MAVPKKRTSRQKRDQRRANWKISPPNVTRCASCAAPVLSHRICPACGTYKGKQVVQVAE
ncbi:MAG TPA: 50S ribosomal protein L32 [Vulgatibacter sp.]|nr:50S ribosomal protein L32 [Vulgatibacter sp.]